MAKKVDISQHFLVPKHRILSNGEVNQLLEKYKIRKFELPKILKSDEMIKKIGAEPGQVIEITRKSQTTGIVKYYRVVINE